MSKKEELKEFVGKFVVGLTKLMREAAHETVDVTFSDDDEADGAGGGPKVQAVKSARRASAPKQLKAAPNGITDKQLLLAVKQNPGARTEKIAEMLGTKSADIRGSLATLAAIGSVKKSGAGRGTTWSIH